LCIYVDFFSALQLLLQPKKRMFAKPKIDLVPLLVIFFFPQLKMHFDH